jgi:3-keto-disaccharide hydrolase
MKRSLAVALPGLVLMVLIVVPGRSAAPGAKAAGWKDIFPPASLEGWTRVAIPPGHPLSPNTQWSVDAKSHVLVCAGDQGHEWLRYDRELGNFEFKLEWRLSKVEGAKKYNSGVFVRNSSDGRVWYQAQVGSASGGYFFGDNPVDGSLQRFNLRSTLTENRVKEAGKWNTYDLLCRGKKITLSVNGATTSEFDRCNNLAGYLGLEAEGSRIEFRKLRIRILP